MKFNEAYYDSITKAVEEAEAKTSAEIVAVILPQSGSYKDIDYLCGAYAAWFGLLTILFSDWEIHPFAVPVEVVIIFIASSWICSVTPLRRLLSSKNRRDLQVRASASEAFTEEGVCNTRARTGVLVYLSVLEKRIEVIADIGVMAAVPPKDWNDFLPKLREDEKRREFGARLPEDIRALGEMLSRFLPATVDNPDEITNRPRIAK